MRYPSFPTHVRIIACTPTQVLLICYFWTLDHEDLCDDDLIHCGGVDVAVVTDLSMLNMLGVVTFSFTAHVQALSVANEVSANKQRK